MIWSLENLLAWMAQVSLLVVAAGVTARWLGLRSSRLHLWTLQTLLAACLILPAAQPWRRPVVRQRVAEQPAAVSAAPAQAPASTPIEWETAALYILGAGSALRLSWLALGMLRLRRYRQNAMPIVAPQAPLATRAAFARSDEITGPVTFGWLRPVVLVPPSFERLPAAQQTAIASHELIHVRRRDWLWSLLEEIAAALLWFHPGVWWLLSQIRVTREHVVDAEVVKLTGAREHYVDALLSMASSRWQLDLAPAPLFLRRRHLSGRIRSLVVEETMTKTKLATSYIAISAALLSAAWIAVGAFPLLGSPQVEDGFGGVLATIDASALPQPIRGQMEAQLAPFRNLNMDRANRERVLDAALKVAGNLRFAWRNEEAGKVGLAIHPNPHGGIIASMPRRPEVPPLDFGTNTPTVRIGANVAAAKLVSQRPPLYPPQALQTRLAGTVKVAALIGKDGRVKQVYTIKGSSILAPAAEEAVMQYVYQPTLLNGNPIDVATTVDVTFELP